MPIHDRNESPGFCRSRASLAWLVALLAGCGSTEGASRETPVVDGGGPSDSTTSSGGASNGGGHDAAAGSPGTSSGGSGGTVATASGGAATGSGGASADAGPTDAGAEPAAGDAGSSPCTISQAAVECRSAEIVTITSGTDTRRVYWNDPVVAAPSAGFPAVVLFQGSIFGPSLTWNVSLPRGTTPFGGDVQVGLVATLLDHGFVVVQPEAQGGLAWNTNTGGVYDATPDAVFIPKLLDEISKGTFGPVDTTHLYATGISSGGYMTSRMAVSYPGRFRALAIESGSYATCLGPLCSVPGTLPADHPPTLFLHGAVDTTVPIATAKSYFDKLQAQGFETKFVEDPAAGHQWIAAAPQEVLAWFTNHD